MENTSEKKSFIKSTLSKMEDFFWSTKIRAISSSLIIGLAIISFLYISINRMFYITSKSNLFITSYNDSDINRENINLGWFSSAEETAEILLLIGEKNIQNGDYEEALFGSDSIYHLPEEIKGAAIKFNGLNEIVSDSKLKRTNSAEQANYWIGICYYKLGELTDIPEEKVANYEKAIEYLDKETSSDIFNSFKQSQIGDCFSQLGEFEKALKYYQNALNEKNEVIRLEILYKAAETAKILEKDELAIKYYKEIINDFPKSQYVSQVNKKIAELLAKSM